MIHFLEIAIAVNALMPNQGPSINYTPLVLHIFLGGEMFSRLAAANFRHDKFPPAVQTRKTERRNFPFKQKLDSAR